MKKLDLILKRKARTQKLWNEAARRRQWDSLTPEELSALKAVRKIGTKCIEAKEIGDTDVINTLSTLAAKTNLVDVYDLDTYGNNDSDHDKGVCLSDFTVLKLKEFDDE